MSRYEHSLREANKLLHNFHAPSASTDKSIIDYLSSLDCPRALTVALLFKYGEHVQLLALKCDPIEYNIVVDFHDAYAATLFLSKADFLVVPFKKDVVAYEKFAQYEQLCKHTNDRFRNLSLDPLYRGSNASLLFAMQRKIASILGQFNGDEWFDSADWGPGVTTNLKGCHVSATNKFHSENGITRDLYALVGPLMSEAYPSWHEHLSTRYFGEEGSNQFVTGNSLCTVPKNSKTDRVIAVEPGLNLWFQKGIGAMIRRRLRRVGIDLQDQSHNQRFALLASKTGHLATIDFSSASDSIATELIREVLPHDWFLCMDASRSKLGVTKAESVRWNKFSSMGNGFTFELESLIFFAAAQVVCDYLGDGGSISVYGDDVIIPTPCVKLFSEFCTFLGFKVNMEKSFFSPDLLFRESCGSHYFRGFDCKPIFLKEKLRNAQSFYKLANSIRLLAHRSHFNSGCDKRFRNCYYRLVEGVPRALRLGVPSHLGDIGFIQNFDEVCPPQAREFKKFQGFEGYLPLAVVSTAKRQPFEGFGLLLSRIRYSSDRAYGNFYTLRGRTTNALKRVLVHQWYNLGEWS